MKISGYIVISLAVILIQGCSTKQVYNTIQHNAKLKCQEVPYSEYAACMERTNTSYEEYSRKREEIIEEK